MTEKEKTIQRYMEKLGLSKEEATQLYMDDVADFIGEDGEEMGQKAKALKRHYEQGTPKRKSSTKERKVDTEKKELLEHFAKVLTTLGISDYNVKTETEISFCYHDSDYTLKLTKHRKKKSE